MSNLRMAMDCGFWNLNVGTSRTLEGSALAAPGDPMLVRPTSRPEKLSRLEQLNSIQERFKFWIYPCMTPASSRAVECFGLQSILSFAIGKWCAGIIGQVRPWKIMAAIVEELKLEEDEELIMPEPMDIIKHFMDKSLYSVYFSSSFFMSSKSSLCFRSENKGENGHRSKVTYQHQLPYHDVTLDAAWSELFIDGKGNYWDIPSSVSLDMSSIVSDSGFRYRVGLHKSNGEPHALDTTVGSVPSSLMPGIYMKAAFSYQRSIDFWREPEKRRDLLLRGERYHYWWFSFDEYLKEPHGAIGGIIGGSCTTCLGGNGMLDSSPGSKAQLEDKFSYVEKTSLFSADAFSSICCSFQHGRFKKTFKDLTRADARLDFPSALALMKGTKHLFLSLFKGPASPELFPSASPKLSMCFQQQIAGPLVFRVDTRSSLNLRRLQVEDTIFSLNYTLPEISGKVVFWYSPKRKEGMVELRFREHY